VPGTKIGAPKVLDCEQSKCGSATQPLGRIQLRLSGTAVSSGGSTKIGRGSLPCAPEPKRCTLRDVIEGSENPWLCVTSSGWFCLYRGINSWKAAILLILGTT